MPLCMEPLRSRTLRAAETQDVFRVVELTSPLDAALLRGPVDVYQGDTYPASARSGA
jgi:hypothetical protein